LNESDLTDYKMNMLDDTVANLEDQEVQLI